MSRPETEWTRFDAFPENTLTCGCGRVYRSHSRFSHIGSMIEPRWPCPGCGSRDDIRRASSDPELMTISGTPQATGFDNEAKEK